MSGTQPQSVPCTCTLHRTSGATIQHSVGGISCNTMVPIGRITQPWGCQSVSAQDLYRNVCVFVY